MKRSVSFGSWPSKPTMMSAQYAHPEVEQGNLVLACSGVNRVALVEVMKH